MLHVSARPVQWYSCQPPPHPHLVCARRRDSGTKRGDGDDEGGDAGAIPLALDFDALPPQAQVVELACRCDDGSDEGVELRLLKALLTAVTSTTLAVHGQALLLVVRACYNIFLTSRSDVNQTTAKATLTQVRLRALFAGPCHSSMHIHVVSTPPAHAASLRSPS